MTSAPTGALPIDAVLPEAVEHLRRAPCLVLEAPPGAGKTTRLPIALLEEGFADDGELLVLQPRRLAARMAARRVAALLGEEVGERCGYQVRFDSRVGPRTRVRFITEGLLSRRLRDDPTLSGIAVVVLDEFHERHIDGDVGLAMLRALQTGARPDLKIVVMSATLDGAPVHEFLAGGDPGRSARVVSDGRAYPVAIEYEERPRGNRERPLAARVLRAFHDLLERDGGLDGDVLVFLPGARAIREASEACEPLARSAGIPVLPLHGELRPEEQDRAVRPSATPRLILSTNVAETSVTIEGVAFVIDSGLHRVAAHDPWSGIATLQTVPIARDSAAQRAGRAGRTRPGVCVRLYSKTDHDRRPEFTTPEVRRLDLAGPLLDLHALGVRDPRRFGWFEPPPEAATAAAETLLARLGAVDPGGALTETGRAMLRFPLHPRLARVVIEGGRLGVTDLACGAAALLGERSVRTRGQRPREATRDGDADVLAELEDMRALQRAGPGAARSLNLSVSACKRARQVQRQLESIARGRRGRGSQGVIEGRELALCQALLAGYPDRVARARANPKDPNDRTLVLCGGGSAKLSPASVVRSAEWAVALTVASRSAGSSRGAAVVESAAAIDPDWLLELETGGDETDGVHEAAVVEFDTTRARVVGRSELRYGALVLATTPYKDTPPGAAEVLLEAALAAGPARFIRDPDALVALRRRAAFLREHLLDADVPALDDALIREQLAALCDAVPEPSFAALERADLLAHIRSALGPASSTLDTFAPTHVRLPGGRRVPVHYEDDRPPWIESRLQDFFGMRRGPTLPASRVPLVLHLLAPNRRAVQVTTDLEGFWARHYPTLRKQLMRRYSKHAWPEDPLTAEPPKPRQGRRRTR